jgi:hypothetical protein
MKKLKFFYLLVFIIIFIRKNSFHVNIKSIKEYYSLDRPLSYNIDKYYIHDIYNKILEDMLAYSYSPHFIPNPRLGDQHPKYILIYGSSKLRLISFR